MHKSFRRLLLRAILAPTLVVVILSGMVDYFFASQTAQDTQDAMLLRTANALAIRLSPDEDNEGPQELARHFGNEPQNIFKSNQDEIDFLVLDAEGDLLVGSHELASVAKPFKEISERPLYTDNALGGRKIRSVQFIHRIGDMSHHIIVSESRLKKNITANKIFWNTLWPNILLLVVMTSVIAHGTRKALRPLQQICVSIDQRASGDLSPIFMKSVPLEIMTLINAMNRMLQRLTVSQNQQQIFLSGAAHQLRTPLAGIQTQLELALDETSGLVRDRLVRVLDAIQNLSHCSQQMLALARSSAQSSSGTEYAHIDLAELLQDQSSIWLDMALKKHIELVFDLEPTPVCGVRWMLLELTGNLIDNAIKYSPENSEIMIRCHQHGDGDSYFEVIDPGIGISQEDKHQITSPFYRGSHPQIGGSGLGLTIVGEILSRHNGQISFENNSTGQGTHVRVVFKTESETTTLAQSNNF